MYEYHDVDQVFNVQFSYVILIKICVGYLYEAVLQLVNDAFYVYLLSQFKIAEPPHCTKRSVQLRTLRQMLN